MAAAAAAVDPHRLVATLQGGQDDEAGVRRYLAAGYRPQELLGATLGNGKGCWDSTTGGCPRSLHLLLAARADPNEVDPRRRGGSSLLHVAAWTSSPKIVSVLLEHGADLERKEPETEVPALNSALAAGNAPVALLLLERGADASWRHKDGATALHVALSWLTDAAPEALARRRPPSLRVADAEADAEPVRLVRALIRAGADPNLPMIGKAQDGVTALGAFRSAMPGSPWLRQADTAEDFTVVSKKIFDILEAAEKAMRLKNDGNKAFSQGSLQRALSSFQEARSALEGHRLDSGQHLAVLCSNEALCHKKLGDFERSRLCCEAGLREPCSEKVRTKLEFNKEAAVAALAAAVKVKVEVKATASDLGIQAAHAASSSCPNGSGKSIVATASQSSSSSSSSSLSPPTSSTASPSSEAWSKSPTSQTPQAQTRMEMQASGLKAGFLARSGAELYGPKGSEQGRNHSDLVKVPVFGTRHEVPFGKVKPIVLENDQEQKGED